MPTTLPQPKSSTVAVLMQAARHFLGAAVLLVAIVIVLLWAHLPARAHAVARIGLRLGDDGSRY